MLFAAKKAAVESRARYRMVKDASAVRRRRRDLKKQVQVVRYSYVSNPL